MAKPKSKAPISRDELAQDLTKAIGELLAEKITHILDTANEEDMVKCAVGITIKSANAVPHCVVDLHWSERFSVEAEFTCADPDQPELIKEDTSS